MGLKKVIENFAGALEIGLNLLAPWRRKKRIRWGATDEECASELPGDEFVPDPKWMYNHAISIQAPASRVWPWLVQIGQGRGGFYSYTILENIIGCKIKNAEKILPEFQQLKVGDEIKLHPKAPGLAVARLEPGQALVLHAQGDEQEKSQSRYGNSTWQFIIKEVENGKTRLITRGRYDYTPTFTNRLFTGSTLIEPISFVMEKKMLKEIKRLVELNGI